MNDFLPFGQIGLFDIQLELLGNNAVDALVVQHFRAFVNAVHIVAAHDGTFFNVTEQCNLTALVRRHFSVHTADQDVRLQTNAQHFFNGMLGRFGFDFAGSGDVRYIAQVGKQCIVAAELAAHLTDGFQERQRFDIADCTADFDNRHIITGRAFMDTAFDFIGNVRNHLYSTAQIVAATLFGNHVFIDLAGTETVAAGHGGVDETLIVTEVEVGFRAVIGYEYFAVLKRAHGTRVNVDIRVKLKHGHVQATRLENSSNRSGGDTFTQRRYNAAGYENKFSHDVIPMLECVILT